MLQTALQANSQKVRTEIYAITFGKYDQTHP